MLKSVAEMTCNLRISSEIKDKVPHRGCSELITTLSMSNLALIHSHLR